tara:strand:+ start:344 stop:535 length:192 start_codon:yes stop_codon:yes gene_type:complete
MTKKDINETIEKFLRSDRVEKATGGDEIEKMKLRNMIEVAIRKQAPDWLKEMIEEDDARITKH